MTHAPLLSFLLAYARQMTALDLLRFLAGLALVLGAGAAAVYALLRIRRAETERRRLQGAMAEQDRRLAAITSVADVTSRSLRLREILAGTLDKTLEVTGLDAGGIYLLQEEAGGGLVLTVHRGLGHALAKSTSHLQVGEGHAGQVVQTGRLLIIRDLSADPRLGRLAAPTAGYHSLAAVPIGARGHILGALFVISRGRREFLLPEIDLLGFIGRQVGVAVENARLFSVEQRRAEQFRVIAEVSRHFTTTLDINALLQQAVALIQQAFGFYHVGIGLVEGDEVVYRVGAGVLWDDPGFEFKPARLKVGTEGLTGWVAGAGQPLLVPDVGQDPRYVLMQGSQARSEMVVPIIVKGQTIGVLDAQSDRLNGFDQKDLAVLQSLANQAGAAVENARLYARAQQLAVMEERSRLSRELHDSVTQALYGMTLYAQAAAGQLAAGNLARVAEHLRELQATSQEALAEMRLLIFELRPLALQEEGLAAALKARLAAVEERAGLKAEFQSDLPGRLPLKVEEELYRVALEALNNILKHAHARRIELSLRQAGPAIRLLIADDGSGFDPTAARAHGGLGLAAMEERAEKLGGRFSLRSQPGCGTQVLVELNL